MLKLRTAAVNAIVVDVSSQVTRVEHLKNFLTWHGIGIFFGTRVGVTPVDVMADGVE